MRTVELVPGIRSSVLGFGCAPVLGAVGPEIARTAIHTALDAGVTHFDLARSYGFGEAEAFVGQQLKGVRDELVLVTKFGITATTSAALLRPFKPLIRAFRGRPVAAKPNASGVSERRRLGHLLLRRLPMTAETMRTSLERSLRALSTDRVEFLLMHEPVELSRFSELVSCAEALKREGKIRGWGLAALHESPLRDGIPLGLDLMQTNVPAAKTDYEKLCVTQRGYGGFVLFSPFRGVDVGNRDARLRQLWTDYPRAVILCSMFQSAHIRSNAALAS